MVGRRVERRGGGGEAASAAAAAAIGRVGAAVDQVRLHVEGQEAGAGLEGREGGSSLVFEYGPVGFKNQIWRLANIFEHLLTRVHLPL